MSRFWRIATACVALALAGYFIYFVAKTVDVGVVKNALSSPLEWIAIFGAALLYALIIPVTAWAWRRLLTVQHETWSWPTLAVLLGLTQLAKYIPGNVAQHATRAALSLRAGIGTRAFVATVSQETVLAVAASLLVGLPLMALSSPGLGQISPQSLGALLVIAAVLAVAVIVLASARLNPKELLGHSNRLVRLLGHVGGLPGSATTLMALAAYAFNYLVIGLGLWLVARATDMPHGMDFALVTGTFALSWALGFLAPGAPAGLGAREGIMLLLLRGSAPDETLLVFVVLARMVTMLGDAVCFAVASGWRMRKIGTTEASREH
ncbi:MAG: lysylphosphatidylglycerol synthase domain-containing protein [Pseudoxanthomonas sp.]